MKTTEKAWNIFLKKKKRVKRKCWMWLLYPKKGKIFIFNENFTEKKIFVEPVNNAWKPLKKHVMFFLKKI